jgi:hypothetical protein
LKLRVSGVEFLPSRVIIGRLIIMQAVLQDILSLVSVLNLKIVLVEMLITAALGMNLRVV